MQEKAPHPAVRAAQLAGLDIHLAGPIGDERYFDRHVSNELRPCVRWLGPPAVDDLPELFPIVAGRRRCTDVG